MSKVETSDSHILRVVHPTFYRFYDEYTKILRDLLHHGRLTGLDRRFPDGSPGFRIKYGDGTVDSLDGTEGVTALVPFWFTEMAGWRTREVFMMVLETFYALKRPCSDQKAIAKRAIGICPYYGGRSDHPSLNTDGQTMVGETIYGQMVAEFLAKAGCDELITLDLHSYEDARFLKESGIPHLNLTALPLLANYIQSDNRLQNLIGQNLESCTTVSLDYGSLQRNIHWAKLLGMCPVREHIVICEKRRNHLGKTEMEIIFPKVLSPEYPTKSMFEKTLFCLDDLVDTAGSLIDLMRIVDHNRADRLYFLATHGSLSFPAVENIEHLSKNSRFGGIYVSDSLPTAKYDFEGTAGIEVIGPSTATIIANIIPAVLQFGAGTIGENPDILRGTSFEHLLPYILMPQPKEQVLENFLAGRS